jgi:hypothetical protein
VRAWEPAGGGPTGAKLRELGLADLVSSPKPVQA